MFAFVMFCSFPTNEDFWPKICIFGHYGPNICLFGKNSQILPKNWYFLPNIYLSGPFGATPDQKTMQTRILGDILMCVVYDIISFAPS